LLLLLIAGLEAALALLVLLLDAWAATTKPPAGTNEV
jgi:hypothetical protein